LETKCKYIHKIAHYNVCILCHVTVAASQASGLLSLGCLLLEETLILRDTVSEAGPLKRSKTFEPSTEENLWLTLAE